jgi:hypothetical protein
VAADDAAAERPGTHGETDAAFDGAAVAERFDLAKLSPGYYANPYPY